MLDASLFVEARFTKIFKSHIVTVSLTANRGEEVNSLVEQSIMVRLMLSQAITCLKNPMIEEIRTYDLQDVAGVDMDHCLELIQFTHHNFMLQ